MAKIAPIKWRILVCVFERAGFKIHRQTGGHIVMVRPGCPRPVIIPAHGELSVDIIQSNMRTAGMSRDQYLEFLSGCC